MRKVVAVVDDDAAMRGSVGRLLRSAGYDAELLPSGEAMLDCVATSAAVCLVVDIHLGGMSGVELGRQLSARGVALPIIFMSGVADHATEEAAIEVGCVAFLHKPFPANLLMDAIEKALQSPE